MLRTRQRLVLHAASDWINFGWVFYFSCWNHSSTRRRIQHNFQLQEQHVNDWAASRKTAVSRMDVPEREEEHHHVQPQEWTPRINKHHVWDTSWKLTQPWHQILQLPEWLQIRTKQNRGDRVLLPIHQGQVCQQTWEGRHRLLWKFCDPLEHLKTVGKGVRNGGREAKQPRAHSRTVGRFSDQRESCIRLANHWLHGDWTYALSRLWDTDRDLFEFRAKLSQSKHLE